MNCSVDLCEKEKATKVEYYDFFNPNNYVKAVGLNAEL